MVNWYYRYTSDQDEQDAFLDEHKIEADTVQTPTKTQWTTARYDDSDTSDAERELGLPDEPENRYGPLPESVMPAFHNGPSTIQPCSGNACGNALEVEITEPMFVPGNYSYDTGDWEAI